MVGSDEKKNFVTCKRAENASPRLKFSKVLYC